MKKKDIYKEDPPLYKVPIYEFPPVLITPSHPKLDRAYIHTAKSTLIFDM